MIRLSAFADEISHDPAEQIDVLSEHGIKHIEFRSIHATNVLDLADAQHDTFRSLLLDRGLALSAIGSPIGKISIVDPFGPHLDRFARALDLADAYACPRIRIFSFYIPAGDAPAAHRGAVLDRLSALASLASGRGMTLLLENEKGIYGDTADRVLDVLASVDSPALAHAFDPANYLEVGQTIDDAWAKLRPRSIHFHVKDYDPAAKKNVPCGEGAGQIGRLLADAVGHGYEGFAVLEPHLVAAGAMYGFTGPERFGDAARALQGVLRAEGIAFG